MGATEPKIEKCGATVTPEGWVQIDYKWEDNDNAGSDTYTDENVSDWSDEDIQTLVCDVIGLNHDHRDQVMVTR